MVIWCFCGIVSFGFVCLLGPDCGFVDGFGCLVCSGFVGGAWCSFSCRWFGGGGFGCCVGILCLVLLECCGVF